MHRYRAHGCPHLRARCNGLAGYQSCLPLTDSTSLPLSAEAPVRQFRLSRAAPLPPAPATRVLPPPVGPPTCTISRSLSSTRPSPLACHSFASASMTCRWMLKLLGAAATSRTTQDESRTGLRGGRGAATGAGGEGRPHAACPGAGTAEYSLGSDHGAMPMNE